MFYAVSSISMSHHQLCYRRETEIKVCLGRGLGVTKVNNRQQYFSPEPEVQYSYIGKSTTCIKRAFLKHLLNARLMHGKSITGTAYPSGHLVPSLILGLAYAPIVDTSFLELAMSFFDFSP